MELRCGGVGSQAVGRRMDGDSRDGGGGGCKDAGSEDYENLPTSASLSTHMTAGAMAGILEHSVMYPVDSVKVRREETCGTERVDRGARARARVRLHPAPEQPAGAPPKRLSSRLRRAWGAAPRLLPRARRAAPLLPPRAWAPGGAPKPTRVLRPAPRTAAPTAFPTRAAGGAAAGEKNWRASPVSVVAAGCPREAIGAAPHSLTTPAHAIRELWASSSSRLPLARPVSEPRREASSGVCGVATAAHMCAVSKGACGREALTALAGAEKRGPGSAARPPARLCVASASRVSGQAEEWQGFCWFLAALGNTGSATPDVIPFSQGFCTDSPRSSGGRAPRGRESCNDICLLFLLQGGGQARRAWAIQLLLWVV